MLNIRYIINIINNLLTNKSLLYKVNAINNYNYNKSLIYMIPEILQIILHHTNDLYTSRTLYCTSKIFHTSLSKLKTLKYISNHNKNNIIPIYPLLPCFKSAYQISFINYHFDKQIILNYFGGRTTNNVLCDVLISKQYRQISFINCHIESFIINCINKNKSLKKIKLKYIANFCDKYVFNCFLRHPTLTKIKIKHTPFELDFLTHEHIDYLLHLTNHFTNKHCQYLCQLFKKTKVNKISLIDCGINDAYFLLYMKFLLNTNIKYINFSHNLIKKDYHHFIYNCLCYCQHQVTINLMHNPIKSKYIDRWKMANNNITILF